LHDKVTELYYTINGNRDAMDYVMKVRDAAWAVQDTIVFYLGAIADGYAGSQDEGRAKLDQRLCAAADRVLKELNWVIATKLARSG
jgi:hypothetical protein